MPISKWDNSVIGEKSYVNQNKPVYARPSCPQAWMLEVSHYSYTDQLHAFPSLRWILWCSCFGDFMIIIAEPYFVSQMGCNVDLHEVEEIVRLEE